MRFIHLHYKAIKKIYRPFGDAKRGTYFSSLDGTDGGHYKIVGFHGTSVHYVNSIGFYLEPVRSHRST